MNYTQKQIDELNHQMSRKMILFSAQDFLLEAQFKLYTFLNKLSETQEKNTSVEKVAFKIVKVSQELQEILNEELEGN